MAQRNCRNSYALNAFRAKMLNAPSVADISKIVREDTKLGTNERKKIVLQLYKSRFNVNSSAL